MTVIPYLILIPFAFALLTFVAKNAKLRAVITTLGVLSVIGMVAYLAYDFFMADAETGSYFDETETIKYIVMAAEVLLMLLVVVMCIIHKKFWIILLSVIPTGLALYVELSGLIHEEGKLIYVDRLSMLMCIIIAVVGGLIVLYSAGYMKGYHNHHADVKDRSNYFTALLFVFLGAMFGLVLSANLLWIFFFWEITSVCSFLLIGYTKTSEAVTNSFRALWMNLLGGFGFSIAIFLTAYINHSVELSTLVESGKLSQLMVMLLAFAALTKSAQFPFSGWLLGAMVAPTPSSALLHSATMVKAGCYLLLRLAPAMSGTGVGIIISLVGGFTFLMTSFLAISQSDGKKVLAYSTISNLGLIVTCAGVGTAGAVWAGIFLVIFHAVTKSMLFQAVGAIENSTHSRDVETMDGLIIKLRKLGYIMVLGIMGMYLAPFGMLIFKWAALKSFVDAGAVNCILVVVIAFGSSTTLFYWTKWLCKIVSFNGSHEPVKDVTTKGQYVSLFIHAFLVVVLCGAFALISKFYVAPFVTENYGASAAFLSKGNLLLMGILVVLIFIVPLMVRKVEKRYEIETVKSYVAGVNRKDGNAFVNSYGEETDLRLSNWYMEDLFGEKKLFKPSVIISTAIIGIGFIVILAQYIVAIM